MTRCLSLENNDWTVTFKAYLIMFMKIQCPQLSLVRSNVIFFITHLQTSFISVLYFTFTSYYKYFCHRVTSYLSHVGKCFSCCAARKSAQRKTSQRILQLISDLQCWCWKWIIVTLLSPYVDEVSLIVHFSKLKPLFDF